MNKKLKILAVLSYSLFHISSFIIHTSLYASFEGQFSGARTKGMGGAFVGLADTGESMFYNIAGLGQATRMEVLGGYSQLYMGLDDGSNLSNSNVMVTIPVRGKILGAKDGDLNVVRGVVGLGINRYSLSGYYGETSAGIYYGGKLKGKLLYGVGLKYLSVGYGRDAYTPLNTVFSGGMEKTSFSADTGLLMTVNEHVTMGLSIQDINTPDMGLKYEDKIARKMAVGGAYKGATYNVVSDVSLDSVSNAKLSCGGEKWFISNMFAVRAGFGIGTRKYSRVNVGLGYEGENAVVDYAFNYPLSGLAEVSGTHDITMGYRFGSSDKSNIRKASAKHGEMVKEIARGEFSKALAHARESAVLDPNNKSYDRERAKLEIVTGHVTSLEGKVESDRASGSIAKGVAKYVVEDDAQESVTLLSYAYSLNADNAALDKLVKAIAKENNIVLTDQAKSWNIAEQKVYQALEKFKDKKYDETIKLLEEALVLEPNNVTAHKRLGSTFYMLKDNEKARKHWEKAVELAPQDDTDIPQIKELLGKMK